MGKGREWDKKREPLDLFKVLEISNARDQMRNK